MSGFLSQPDPETKCGTCKHWFYVPNPNDLSSKQGECRGAPPCSQMLNPQQRVTFYPMTDSRTDSCAVYKPRLELAVIGGEMNKQTKSIEV